MSRSLSGLVLALWLVLGGCRSDESEPVVVARQFADAARRGDVDALMTVLERPAVEWLERSAERASDQVGGRRAIEPAEMLQVVGVDRTVALSQAKLLEQGDEHASVELTLTDGRSVVVQLIWEPSESESGTQGGAWKVRLPLPGSSSSALSSAQPDA